MRNSINPEDKMLNPTDASSAAAFSFPVQFQMAQMGESPLSKLVQQCNKIGSGDHKMKLEPVKADGLLLPDMNAYSPYLGTQNWWAENPNWLYPNVTSASAVDHFQNYLTPGLNFLSSSVSAVAQSAAALSTQSALTTAMANQQRNIQKQKQTQSVAPPAAPTTTNTAGGKFPSSRTTTKCECPNCQEAEKFGPNAISARKRGVHNCHIAGCGKVYNKSSHLKAHLRWHSQERVAVRKV